MAQVSDIEILGVWKALSGNASTPGWRTIDLIQQTNSCRLKAARLSPSNEEAILVGFATTKIAPGTQLPHGQGFRIERTTLGELGSYHRWLAVIRQPEGNLELFAKVVSDIVSLIQSSNTLPEEMLFQRFLGRVRGWQEFMRQGREGLGPEKELGLIGELSFLNLLIDAKVLDFAAVESWKGPERGLHDFRIGFGSVEIKSTLALEGFPIRIGSLEQLDDTSCPPLFLGGLRFSLQETGKTLTELVDITRHRLEADPAAMRLFELAIHQAGYLDMHAASYTRRFLLTEAKFHLVDGTFPRLAPFNVSPAIRHASYELDLALVTAANHSLSDVLQQLGIA
ncbi:PD-(D/E)XK motif protein [Pseudomonas sp. M2(2023)]|uniref:PD-(D/E)XK motif protein n=1 Tax=Pseudomonas sp. M2(2023) TaxID=3049084 RepID=UPI0025566AAB|nr:PD-(D/E)XK motif protein [Pseudomonas sp. M2(2023)]WIV25888.1 PD-(D/E)XK motif protein [Pseudomonas sp. M2(2023)]